MKKKLPLVIIVISLIQLGMALAYFLKINNPYSFSENMSGYSLVFSGIAFLILGFALLSEQNKS